MIEAWLIWQIIRVTFWVVLGALIFAVIVWKFCDWEANHARRTDSETDRRN